MLPSVVRVPVALTRGSEERNPWNNFLNDNAWIYTNIIHFNFPSSQTAEFSFHMAYFYLVERVLLCCCEFFFLLCSAAFGEIATDSLLRKTVSATCGDWRQIKIMKGNSIWQVPRKRGFLCYYTIIGAGFGLLASVPFVPLVSNYPSDLSLQLYIATKRCNWFANQNQIVQSCTR